MRKNYFIALFLIILFFTLVYNILEDNKRVNSFFKFHTDISNIVIINNKLDKFVNAPISFRNFDEVQNNIELTNSTLKSIEKAEIFLSIKNLSLKNNFFELKNLFKEKIILMERIKSNSAILNNSFRNITKLYPKIENKEFIEIYTKTILLHINPEISYEKLFRLINSTNSSNNIEKFFLAHAKLIIKNLNEFELLKNSIKNLQLDNKIKLFEEKYSTYIKSVINDVKYTILILVIILTLVIFAFLIYSYKIFKNQIELKRFKSAVENSDNFILITDKNKKIKYINQSMLDTMDYKLNEVLGEDPAIFRADFVDKNAYKEINKTIFSGKKWTGEFINKTKSGKILYEKASITPIFDEKGNIEEFLGIKLDITKEKEFLNSLKEKDHRLTQQAKLVIMNEILNSIAHQWRQPLSVISTATSGLSIHKEFKTLSDEVFEELTSTIMKNTEYLSNTIDNFKSFFKTGNHLTLFNLSDSFKKAYKLIEFRILNNNIVYELPNEKIFIKGIENDFIQVIVNIFNNSMDALEGLKEEKRFIFISISKDEKSIYIKIKDNAKGMESKNLAKVFQPYFTTKYNSQGTGMGLYMCHEIITKQFNGKISLNNIKFIKDNKGYKGIEVVITLPLEKDIVNGIKSKD